MLFSVYLHIQELCVRWLWFSPLCESNDPQIIESKKTDIVIVDLFQKSLVLLLVKAEVNV